MYLMRDIFPAPVSLFGGSFWSYRQRVDRLVDGQTSIGQFLSADSLEMLLTGCVTSVKKIQNRARSAGCICPLAAVPHISHSSFIFPAFRTPFHYLII